MKNLMWMALALGVALHCGQAPGAQVGSAFTYQAEVKQNGVLLVGTPDLEFRLYDSLTQGVLIGTPVLALAYPVADGRLTVDLDFGAAAFNTQARWLEIRVDGVVLNPRQRLSAAPVATRALSVADGSVDSPSIVNGSINQLDIDPSSVQTRIGASCAAGSSIRAIAENGTVSCEGDDVGGIGDITGVTAGAGLSGGGDNGAVTLGVGPGAITASMLGSEAVGAAAIAVDAVGSGHIANGSIAAADINTAQVQVRVANSCAVGSSIRQINADGSVVCAAGIPASIASPRPAFSRANIDLPGQVRDISMVLGVDGLGLMSWYDTVGQDLHLSHCNDIACNAVTDTLIDSAGDVGEFSSISIGAQGLGVVSYYDRSNGDLKFAACADVICSSAQLITVDSGSAAGENVGRATSLVISSDGRPAISYYDVTRGDLKLALCGPNPPYCNTRTLVTVDGSGGGDVGRANALVLQPEGAVLKFYMAYYDATLGDLKLARCFENNCGAAAISIVDAANDAGSVLALSVSSDGLPLIAYSTLAGGNTEVRTAHCSNLLCSTQNKFVLFAGAFTLTDVAILIAGDSLPIVAPMTTAGLNFSHCTAPDCSSYSGVGLGTGNLVLAEPSPFAMINGADGYPLIATRRAAGNGNLNILHCSDHLCIPYRRR